jgi:translation elongation factor EF-G
MNNSNLALRSLIAEMAEDDLEFQQQLTTAIYNGLKELKEQYLLGTNSKNEEVIKQIRHKTKPTLHMFEFNELAEELQHGKEILESVGFNRSFEQHLLVLLDKIDVAIQDVHALL